MGDEGETARYSDKAENDKEVTHSAEEVVLSAMMSDDKLDS